MRERTTGSATRIAVAGVAVVIAALTALTVYVQVERLGIAYVGLNQYERHLDVLAGRAGNPWQYRVLSEYVVAALATGLKGAGVESAHVAAFLTMRIVQNALIFASCFVLYRRLGHSRGAALTGLGLVAAAFTQALYDSDLSFNTYTDVLAYAAAAVLLLAGRAQWAVALTAVAVLNRETALLMPVMIVVLSGGFRDARALRLGVVALALGAAAYAAPRLLYGTDRPMVFSYGREIGLDLLAFNLRPVTLRNVALTCGVVIVLAAAGWRTASPIARKLAVNVALPWVVVHLFTSILAETRLLLVPTVLAGVPLALGLLGRDEGPPQRM